MTPDNHPTSNVSPLTSHVTEDEINLLDYWRVLVKRRLLIGIIVGAATASILEGSMYGKHPSFRVARAPLMEISDGFKEAHF